MTIPLSTPNLFGNEQKYVEKCLKTGWISSAGQYVNLFEQAITEYTKINHSIACMNGTVGLQTSLNLLGVKPNDIVLTTNLTFVATLNAIMYTNAHPILFDIKEDTWQMDLELVINWLERETKLITKDDKTWSIYKKTGQRIAALLPVHVLGGICDPEKLKQISKSFSIPLIEDSTEALGSFYKDQHAGSFGNIGVLSFNGNKIISTGGGGMILTNDHHLAKRAKHITTTAKSDDLFYVHDEIGYNYRMVNILAAVGVAQMENFITILNNKKQIDRRYKLELGSINSLSFQKHIDHSEPNCWLFTFRTPKMLRLLNFLNSNGVQSRPFWTPMNRLPMYSQFEYVNEKDVSGNIFNECISIPCSSNLTEQQQDKVIKSIKSFAEKESL